MARIMGPLTRVNTSIILTKVGEETSEARVFIPPHGPESPINIDDGYYNVDVVNQPTEVDPIYLTGDVSVNNIFSRGASGGDGGAVSGVVVLRDNAPVPEGTPAGTVIVRI